MISQRIRSLFHPELYHGWQRKKSYFEGWYFKLVSADEKNIFAIIPGIAMDADGNKQSFIQVFNGKDNYAEYIKFDAKEFKPHPEAFDVSIGKNKFSTNKIILDLPDIKGEIYSSNHIPWPNEWYSPGIMGPFSFVPFMQCYHGILSMNHQLSGFLEYKGDRISFDGGKGYMEKDWGQSFPSGYIWMQSNHFDRRDTSLKSSVAHIPWLFSSFTGYIAGVWLEDRIIEFTTYNFTKLRKCYVDENKVILVYENAKHLLELEALRLSLIHI